MQQHHQQHQQQATPAILVLFKGHPGVGKSTLSRCASLRAARTHASCVGT
jgi:adenylylsulfate kinase-like enzyme